MVRALWVGLPVEADYRELNETLEMHMHSSVYLEEIITNPYLLNTYCVLGKAWITDRPHASSPGQALALY